MAGRSLARTTKLGTLALGGVEALHVAHEVENGKNFFVVVGKSTVSLAATLTGVGTLGALGAKYFGPIGSLLGVGAGTMIGCKVSDILSS